MAEALPAEALACLVCGTPITRRLRRYCSLACVGKAHRRHGARDTAEYTIWCGMIKRCENPKQRFYPDYGGRGIRVCEEWRHDFSAFLACVGPRPSPQHSIDRIDNDGNYEPGNVRWATKLEQARNSRAVRFVLVNGERMIQREAARVLGVSAATITHMVRRGQLERCP